MTSKTYTVETSRADADHPRHRITGPAGAGEWHVGDDELRMRLAMVVDGLNEAFAEGVKWARQRAEIGAGT